jgi:hypothetical protein
MRVSQRAPKSPSQLSPRIKSKRRVPANLFRVSDNFKNSRSHGRRGAVRDRAERVRKARTPRPEAQVLGRQRRPPRPPLLLPQRRRRDHRLRPSLPLPHRPPPPARDLPHPRIILSLSLS